MKVFSTLTSIKLLHTVVWAFFAGCILAIPIAAYLANFGVSAILITIVIFEVLVLAANRWSCPLTAVAARYTAERRENFDIFLPLWLAKYNKAIFGSLFVGGTAFAIYRWVSYGSAA